MEEETPKLNQEKPAYVDPATGHFLKGNPGGGRPKGSVSVVAAIRRKLEEIAPGEGKRTYMELLVDKMFEKGIVDGDVAMMRDITDRTDGKPAQSVDMTTNGKDIPQPVLVKFIDCAEPTEDNGDTNRVQEVV